MPSTPIASGEWSSNNENDNYMTGLTNFESAIILPKQAMQNAMTSYIST